MYPTLFSIHNGSTHIEVASYSFFMLVAMIFVVSGSFIQAKKRQKPTGSTMIALSVLLLSMLIGARLLHVITHIHLYQKDILHIFSIETSGFSLFGGVIFSIIAGLLLQKFSFINVWEFGDIIAPNLGIGIALIRVGCFLNGCCFGKETILPWGVRFPLLSDAHRYQLAHGSADFFTVHPVHPTQLYEIVAALIASGIAFYLYKKGYTPGIPFLVFGTVFTGFRFLNHYVRTPPVQYDASPLFFPILYMCVFLMGVFAIVIRLFMSSRTQQ